MSLALASGACRAQIAAMAHPATWLRVLPQGLYCEPGGFFIDPTQAVDVVNRILPVVEAEGHHPDLYVRWGGVTVYLWTHAIDGLSENDFTMAAKIERVYDAMAAELFLGAD